MQRWTKVPAPYTALDAATFVERHARPQPEDDSAFFAITRTESGEVLGSISFGHIDWAFGVAHVGYWVARDARREGVATGALGSLRRVGAAASSGWWRCASRCSTATWRRCGWPTRAGFERAGLERVDGDQLLAFVRRLGD